MAKTKPTTTSRPPWDGARETLAQTIEREIGQNVFLCYQCVKCSSGCPLAQAMDMMPNQVMRAVQLDNECVLESKAIWLCAACQTCTTRCPQGLDVAKIMDMLRIEAKRQGLPPAIPEIDKFSTLFLRDIGLLGRLHEVGLMAGLNLMTGQLFKDMDMGWEMLKRRKLKLIPTITRSPKTVKPVESNQNTIAYFPGCSLHSTAAEYDQTIRAVAEVLDLELVEPPDWICCGSSPAHSTDHTLATVLPMRTLATVEQMGLDTVTAPCSACFARMKAATHTLAHDEEMAKAVEAVTGYVYQGRVTVQHLLDTLVDRAGLDRIEASTRKPLTGLKIACYYGCLVTRPPQITQAEHVEYPTKMDDLLRALGAEPVDWSYKTECCGGALGLTQTPLALDLTRKVLQNAYDCGADIVSTVCPLCHVNLDARQRQIGLDFQLPVLYVTQLMAVAFGLGEKRAALDKNFLDPKPVLGDFI
ncbi:MAG: heterodisulfide reductase-related iron-sulfur binding cluster [Anaerolineae bacterium]|nr:heterodisulfide reductase-related iron-sulfur binding cluster [Anaerolineae bacterium]